MVKLSLQLLLFALMCSCYSSNKNKIIIKPIEFNEDGLLKLQIAFQSEQVCTLYQWNSDLYPLLNRALFVTAISKDGDTLQSNRHVKFLPKAPHEKDTVITKDYVYKRPLLLEIKRKDGETFKGCFSMKITYDISMLKGKYKFLSDIVTTSNEISVCNDKTKEHR